MTATGEHFELASGDVVARKPSGATAMALCVEERTRSETEKNVTGEIRKHPRLAAMAIFVAAINIPSGYEQIFVGSIAALPKFQEVFGREQSDGKYVIPATWISLWALSSPLGMIAGALISGSIQDRIGRRLTILIAGIMQAAVITLSYIADELPTIAGRGAVYFVGKLLQGFTVAILVVAAQTWNSEVLPTALRGSVLSLAAPLTLFGQFVASLVIKAGVSMEGRNSYRVPIATQWAFSLVPLLVPVLVPESPVWLMRRGQWDQAARACKLMEGCGRAARNEMQTYERLKAYVQTDERPGEASYSDIFFRSKSNRRRTLITVFVNLLPGLFGLPLLGHSSYLAEVVGMDARDATTLFVIGTVLAIIASLAAFWVVPRVGRRRLLIPSMSFITVAWLGVGISGCVNFGGAAWYLEISLVVIITTAAVGTLPVVYAVAGETSSLHTRAKSQGLGWMGNALMTAILSSALPFLYNSDEANIKGKIGFLFLGLAGFGAAGCWLWVPEMRGKTPLELDEMFEMNLPTRMFKDYRTEVEDTK